jgi:hypothetical protein
VRETPAGSRHVFVPDVIVDRGKDQVSALAAHHRCVADSGRPHHFVHSALRDAGPKLIEETRTAFSRINRRAARSRHERKLTASVCVGITKPPASTLRWPVRYHPALANSMPRALSDIMRDFAPLFRTVLAESGTVAADIRICWRNGIASFEHKVRKDINKGRREGDARAT